MAHQRSLSGSVSALPNFLSLATSVRRRALGSIAARTFGRFALQALAVSLLALSAAVPGFAATDTVTSLADDGSAGTLRSVIAAAAPGDTIVFSVSGTITLASGQLELSQNLTISGPGAANLAISGNNASTVFRVDNGVTVSISGVTIENGSSNYGGGITNFGGTVTVNKSTLSGNSSQFGGGGILSEGTLTVSNSTLSGNSSQFSGGGISTSEGAVTVSNSTLSGNSSQHSAGGILNQGTMTVSNSTLSGNSGYYGGGIGNGGGR